MGTKIVELPPAPNIKNEDLIPISKNVSSIRNTYKASIAQIGAFITSDLSTLIDESTTNKVSMDYLHTHFVHVSGDNMEGNLNLSGFKIQQFSGDIKTITGDIFLNQNDHNGCILLVEKGPIVTTEDRVLLKINRGQLKEGFNALIIQTGDIQAKISNPDTFVDIVNSDGSLSTRQKYSQINLVVLKTNPTDKDLVWISGDIV